MAEFHYQPGKDSHVQSFSLVVSLSSLLSLLVFSLLCVLFIFIAFFLLLFFQIFLIRRDDPLDNNKQLHHSLATNLRRINKNSLILLLHLLYIILLTLPRSPHMLIQCISTSIHTLFPLNIQKLIENISSILDRIDYQSLNKPYKPIRIYFILAQNKRNLCNFLQNRSRSYHPIIVQYPINRTLRNNKKLLHFLPTQLLFNIYPKPITNRSPKIHITYIRIIQRSEKNTALF